MISKFENNTSFKSDINSLHEYERLYSFVRNPLLEKHAYNTWLFFKSQKY